jgi:hypothetical protein
VTELVGALWLVAGLGILAALAVLAASCLRPRSALELLLSAYVLGWLWLVAVLLALSPLGLVTRRWLLAGLVAGLGLALLTWNVSGRPRPPSFRSVLELLSIATRRPAVAVLAVAVLVGFLYSVALALSRRSTRATPWHTTSYASHSGGRNSRSDTCQAPSIFVST